MVYWSSSLFKSTIVGRNSVVWQLSGDAYKIWAQIIVVGLDENEVQIVLIILS